MEFIGEMVNAITYYITKPISIGMVSGLTICAIITQTWIDLCISFMLFQFNIFWKSVICTVGILSLPLRAISALQRERMMEMRMEDMENERVFLIQDKRKNDQRLEKLIGQYGCMHDMYVELEDEHDEAVCKLELLKNELENLKIENKILKNSQKWKNENNDKTSPSDATEQIELGIGTGTSTSTGPSDERHILDMKRKTAVFQSGFSSLMSLLVGLVALQAKDHCMPLLVALLTTTIISTKSVLKYFSTIKYKPANQAIVLLGLNCFILGALTCPMMPTMVGGMLFLSPEKYQDKVASVV